MKKHFHLWSTRVWHTFAVLMVLFAILATLARVLTPILNHHRVEVENLASRLLDTPVTIASVHAGWHGYHPGLRLQQVVIHDKQTGKPSLQIQELDVDINIWKSLRRHEIQPDLVSLSGLEINVKQEAAGEIDVVGIKKFSIADTMSGSTVETHDLARWILRASNLDLKNVVIHWFAVGEKDFPVTIDFLNLSNDGHRHVLSGHAAFTKGSKTDVDLKLNFQGNIFDPNQLKAKLYVYLKDVSLSAWLQGKSWRGLQAENGLGSMRIWVEWDHGVWQQIQSVFQFYDVDFKPLDATKQPFAVDRLSGHIGWRPTAKGWVFAGNEILIDLPNHLWPMTGFYIEKSTLPVPVSAPPAPAATTPQTPAVPQTPPPPVLNQPVVVAPNQWIVKLGYLDIGDVQDFLFGTTVLPDQTKQLLQSLNLDGEFYDFAATAPDDFKDYKNITLATQFTDFKISAWNSIPELSGLTGNIIWNKSQGDLVLTSKQCFVMLPKICTTRLAANQMSGHVHVLQKTDGGWSLKAENLAIQNAALKANASLSLEFPASGALPAIDLNGKFSLHDVAHITEYLPMRLFEPGLEKWLKQAFRGGEITDGSVVVRGNLPDYPFEAGNGTVSIKSQVKDLEFHFAPAWPALQHVNGELDFTATSMHANVQSASLLNIPVTNVIGDIPYIGPKSPQILSVVAKNIHTDFAQGMEFIKQSPLQEPLRDLTGLDLTGPADLDLTLSVPLRHPENTTALGNLLLKNTKLQLPDWKIAFDQINGAIKFTESSIAGSNLQGNLFGSPATLNITTEKTANQQSVAHAVLQGKVNVPTLEKSLGVSLAKFVSGETTFQADLFIPPTKEKNVPHKVQVTSNLVGVAVNLPDFLAKAAKDPRDLQVSINMQPDKPLQIQSSYGQLLSTALTYQKSKSTNQLNGEVHFGSGAARGSDQPGILITGTLNRFDWEKWRDYLPQFANKSTPKTPQQQNAVATLPNFDVRGLNVVIGTLPLFGKEYSQVGIRFMKGKDAWSGDIRSALMTGQLSIPFDFSKQAIRGTFQQMSLDSGTDNQKRLVNPTDIPAVQITCDDLLYAGKHLGQMALRLTPQQGGARIEQFDLHSALLNFRSHGEWLTAKTTLQGEISTTQLSNLLTQLGVDTSFVGKLGDINFNFYWPGAPYQYSVKSLGGTLSLKLGEGRVVDLSDSTATKMGLGRMLNLLSLKTLPRRLTFDFSDLFQKGYSFDVMKGDFNFQNGDIITKNAYFDGPVARIELAGRIGWAAKDYDLEVRITPYVTSSLPLVATIAGGPIAGVATWVIDKMISSQVSKASTYHYRVTGPWANPVWNPHEAGKKAP